MGYIPDVMAERHRGILGAEWDSAGVHPLRLPVPRKELLDISDFCFGRLPEQIDQAFQSTNTATPAAHLY
jgi:hypothetical protein